MKDRGDSVVVGIVENLNLQTADERKICFVLMAGKYRGFAAEKILFHYSQRTGIYFCYV